MAATASGYWGEYQHKDKQPVGKVPSTTAKEGVMHPMECLVSPGWFTPHVLILGKNSQRRIAPASYQ